MNQKNLCFILLLLLQCSVFAQSNKFYEKPPVFPECESVDLNMLQACFDSQVFKKVFNSFTVPDVVLKENYQGNVVILFEVDKDGAFRVIYVDAIYSELKDEAKRVFDEFPKIKPATYNGNPTFKQYSFSLKIPLVEQTIATKDLSKDEELAELEHGAKQEYDSVNANLKPFSNKEYTSQLNIPFTHEYYSRFGKQINLVGTNSQYTRRTREEI